MGPFGETGTVKIEKPYTVWAFRVVSGCYECDKQDTTEFNFPVESIKLTQEEFDAFLVGAKQFGRYESFIYLYKDSRLHLEESQSVHELIKKGHAFIEEQSGRAAKHKLQEEKRLKDVDKKKLAKEQKLYADLKKKFEEKK